MSYLFSSSYPKVRQEGFQTQSTGGNTPQPPIPAPNAFDPNSIYTTGALFADAYRATQADPFARRYEQQQQQPAQPQSQQQQGQQPGTSLDIHDELSFLNPPTSATSESFQQQTQRPHDIFGVNQPHYPSLSLPHSRPLYSRDDFSSTTPASVHSSYGRPDYFPNGQQAHPPNAGDARHQQQQGDGSHDIIPQQRQQQPQQQTQYGIMPSAISNTSAAQSAMDSFNPGGEQAVATGVTRSRSRSRSKVSASRSRVSKRPSLPAPPHEEGGESPDSGRAQSITRPSAIVIPGHGHHPSHSFSSYHTPGGGHPTSPATWGFPAGGDQLFGQSFGSLGPGQSPTTHSGSPPGTANPDTAAKLALANEKRRKRRESHNAVERRRRDNINEKIQELAMLLPEEWLDTVTSPGGRSGGGLGQGPSLAGLLSGTVSGSALSAASAAALDDDSKEVKANKGVILRNSVEYIKNLVQLVQVQRVRNQQLESELAQYRTRFGNVGMNPSGGARSSSMNGPSTTMPMNTSGISPEGGMPSSGQMDDETSVMASFVLADSLNSPEGYETKNMYNPHQSSIGPLDTITGAHHANAHGHSLSTGQGSMEGVENSSGTSYGLGSGIGAVGQGPSVGMQANSSFGVGGNLGVVPMLTDKPTPSTGSGEGDDGEDEEYPRGRRTTRFPAGVGKQEDETLVL